MSIVKRGAYGYGYGQSKPVMNYHTTNPDSVTTVVTEISRLTVNDKPRATLEEVCEEKAGAYFPNHGAAGTVQKHSYSEQKAYQHGSGVGGYGAAPHHDSAGAAQKHGGYGEQKAYQHGADAGGYVDGTGHHDGAGQKQHGYGEHQAYQYGGDVNGYTALHHESTVQKHGYGGQKAYQHGNDAVGGYGHDASAMQKHGYGGEKAYQHGADAGRYGALAHDSTVQKHGYGDHKAYQHGGGAGGYGALHHDSAVQKHGAYGGQKMYGHDADGYGGEHNAYQQGCVDGVGGYDALAVQNQYGYGGGHKASTYDDVGGFDALVQNTTMQKQKLGYGAGHNAYQPACDGVAGFDALVQKNTMQKQKLGYGAGHNAYQPACDGVAGFDALVQNKVMQKQGYGAGGYAPRHGAVHRNQAQAAYGKTYKHQVPGVGGGLPYPSGSVESDCSSDEESDCEEEPAYVKPGTTHQYSTYERRDQNGGRSHYETYQSTTTQGYSGGGYGYGW